MIFYFNKKKGTKFFFIICSLFLLFLVSSCSSLNLKKQITYKKVCSIVERDAQKLRYNYSYQKKIENKKILDEGYYQVLSTDGIILFHPESLIIGKNMSSYKPISEVLKKGEGYVIDKNGPIAKVYIFTKVNNRLILCLNIPLEKIKF